MGTMSADIAFPPGAKGYAASAAAAYPRSMLTALCHSSQSGWVPVTDISRVSDLRADRESLVWAEIDVEDLEPDDPKLIEEEFDLDPLAVEDALEIGQRPKLEAYGNHLFAVFHQLDERAHQLEPHQISCFLRESFVLVIHDGATRTLDEVRARLQASAGAQVDSFFLLHVLMDTVVDDYELSANRLEEQLEELESEALEVSTVRREGGRGPRARLPDQRRLYSVQQQASRLRRYALPLTHSLERIVDPGQTDLTREARARFLDVLDHTLRISTQINSADYLVDAVLDLIRNEQAASLNEINKKLTAWAAIIATPTLISSIYGMNFALLPREATLGGFLFAVAFMTVTALALYFSFKKRGWL
jgi:magnesium transporter